MEKNNSTVQHREKKLVMEREEGTSSGGAVGRREILRRLRIEMGGQVCIPDTWDQETRLQDWSDCVTFSTVAYMPAGLASARASLVEEARQSSTLIQLENRC